MTQVEQNLHTAALSDWHLGVHSAQYWMLLNCVRT